MQNLLEFRLPIALWKSLGITIIVLGTTHCGSKDQGSKLHEDQDCVLSGDNVGGAVTEAVTQVMTLAGAPGAGLLSQAVGFTANQLIGNDEDKCTSLGRKLVALESYTRDQINRAHVRMESTWQENTRRELERQQADLRSKLESMIISLDYLRKAKTEKDFDDYLQSPLGHLNDLINWYEGIANSVSRSNDLYYVLSVYNMLTYQGVYIGYVNALHRELIDSKSKSNWNLPHGALMLQRITKTGSKFAWMLDAIVKRKEAANLQAKFEHKLDKAQLQFLDAAGNDVNGNPPPVIITAYTTFNPPRGPYMQRRSGADLTRVTYINNDYLDFEISVMGGIFIKRSLPIGGKAVTFSNPLKGCATNGVSNCEDISLVFKAGLKEIEEFKTNYSATNDLISKINTDTLNQAIALNAF